MNPKIRLLITVSFTALFFLGCNLEKKEGGREKSDIYHYTADMTNLNNDQIKVELITPHLDKDSLEFVFPVSELAYYNDDLNHGKLISNLKVYDSKNQRIETNKTAPNRWLIYESKKIDRIEYKVDDIWEVRDSLSSWLSSENIFEKGKVIQLSPNATFGYFDGYDQKEFEVILKKPENLYCSSGLTYMKENNRIDTVRTPNLMELADTPFLFTDQEPIRFQVSKVLIEIGVYSNQSKIKTDWVADQIRQTMEAISHYFNGAIPVKKYAFLIYFYPGPIFAATASEHNSSSMWVLPQDWDEDVMGESMASNIKNTALHEFLHIYAPLSIHSEEKLDFDFDNPEMSDHLWLYEGTTTYMQELIKLNEGLNSEASFIGYINDVLEEMQEYRTDVSLIEISEETYGEELGDQFDNVQLRGFLVNLILDIKLREKSNGTYGMKNLIMDLSQKFGKNKSFKDDDLFEIMAEVTQIPDLITFFDNYVTGIKPLPLNEMFGKVGYEYSTDKNVVGKMSKLNPKQEALRNAWLYHSK